MHLVSMLKIQQYHSTITIPLLMLFKVYVIGSKCVQAFKFIVCVVFGTKIYMDIVCQWDLIQILFSLCMFVHFGKRFHYVVCVSQGRYLTLCTPIMVHTIWLNITQNGKKLYSGKQFLFRIGTTCFALFVDGTFIHFIVAEDMGIQSIFFILLIIYAI